jgi:hypothetical protein
MDRARRRWPGRSTDYAPCLCGSSDHHIACQGACPLNPKAAGLSPVERAERSRAFTLALRERDRRGEERHALAQRTLNFGQTAEAAPTPSRVGTSTRTKRKSDSAGELDGDRARAHVSCPAGSAYAVPLLGHAGAPEPEFRPTYSPSCSAATMVPTPNAATTARVIPLGTGAVADVHHGSSPPRAVPFVALAASDVSAPPSAPPDPMMRALYAYNSDKAGMLSLARGEDVRALEFAPSGWCRCRSVLGHEGWAPTSYLEPVPPRRVRPSPVADGESCLLPGMP